MTRFASRTRSLITIAILSLTGILISCEKQEDDFRIVNACFTIEPKYERYSENLPINTGYVDSVFIFNNCTGESKVRYLWDFGDGKKSADVSPKHVYSHSGVYEVTLSTYVSDKFSDSTKVLLNVLIGQKAFKVNKFTNGVGIAKSTDSNFYLLGFSGVYELGLTDDWFLAKFDSELNKTWLKVFVRASDIQPTKDNGLIVSGVDGGFGLSKLDGDGTVQWSKSYVDIPNGLNVYAQETSDNGYITVGTGFIKETSNAYTTIVKTDASGNFVWERNFFQEDNSDSYTGAANVVSLGDGYLVGVRKAGKLIIVKLDLSGEVVWEKPQDLTIGDQIKIALNSGTIVISSKFGCDKFYFFDSNGSYSATQTVSNISTIDFVFQSETVYTIFNAGDHIYSGAIKKASGVAWSKPFYPWWFVNGEFGVWDGTSVSIIALGDSELLMMGNRDDVHDYMYQSVFLAKTDLTGKLK